ncbi:MULTISPECIES: hypothetical protein [Streptomyces]|uniref:SAF domain-containing protein n=1 Tax=Streptomyces koelreuteriae TaxID=2838015 RepID=A0ABX8FRS7_9ACTN|nr:MULTISPECIES: hypothetical protein [Streptomyces]QWB23789.1 hypothetical protein KJK29_14960 [Streptomyces koelreuteriae]UUA06767.1 hypothetical protein NNW98_15030 [Streptomyces koelreuteriae]UUA14396.1 hypothetical protein NNW99_15025 [Streptomyces sp. CRCS-T-1]
MKIQERTGAGAGRSASPAQPSVGDRLPTPPRERKPALAALAVLLILVGALGATMLVLQAGDRVEVVKVTEAIPAGGSVSTSNTTSVMVAQDESIHYVEWAQLDQLRKLKAINPIPAGAVAVGEMFGEKAGVEAGKSTVGLSLKAGQYPSGIKQGDTVAAYRVTADSGSGSSGNSDSNSGSSSAAGNAVIVDQARVTYVPDANSGSDQIVSSTNLAVTLTVDSDKAADLAQAASNSEVALVLVSGNSGN